MMVKITAKPTRITEVGKEEYLFFTGVAYLGMSSMQEFQEYVTAGVQKYGTVFPSSRISNTRTQLYEQFEEQLSILTQQSHSAVYSSGYMASQAAVAFSSQDSELLYCPGIHPSLLIQGNNPNQNLNDNWKQRIIEQVNTGDPSAFTIVLETVNPLTGLVHDFNWLKKIEKSVRVIVDDSHGIGILGKRGEGVISLLPQNKNLKYLLCYSLAKAFSCEGGAISGTKGDITQLKKQPHFTGSTSMAPAFVYAWMNAKELFLEQLKQLRKNISYFESLTRGLDQVRHAPKLPTFYLQRDTLYKHCLKNHMILFAFRYPTEEDPLKVRVVLNALHKPEDLEKLSKCLHKF